MKLTRQAAMSGRIFTQRGSGTKNDIGSDDWNKAAGEAAGAAARMSDKHDFLIAIGGVWGIYYLTLPKPKPPSQWHKNLVASGTFWRAK